MSFIRKFKVLPNLPPKLQALQTLASNLWLAWNPDAIKLFITMDGELWERVQHNPVRMLGEISQERLEELASDDGFLVELQRIHGQLNQYLQTKRSLNDGGQFGIAYFSAEYGLNDTLPIYSGGLGVLSGDHVKSASDLNLNFRGVGLLYQLGYFQQYLNMDGWQQDFYQTNDFHNMQVQEVKNSDGQPLEIDLELPGRTVFLKVWQIQVGRVLIYLLDSNVEKNLEPDRKLTAQLYGGDRETRIQQEIILGMGGVAMLDRLGVGIDVIHMNEGHSAFAPFARARLLMKQAGLNFSEAMAAVRQACVFTTHTNVQAGHDEFSPDMMKKYFAGFAREQGISINDLLAFGRIDPGAASGENFSMTVAAIRNSAYVNGVSSLQAEISRKMWRNIWPACPLEHVPIQAVTNGIHIPSWISFEMSDLFERYLGGKWREKQDYQDFWEKVQQIPDPELWNVHEIRRRRLIAFTRQRLQRQLIAKGASNLLINESAEALNPEVLTIGFARRFVTYKRADLIFRDPERLLQILNNPLQPAQLIIAGKAHPQDQAGKELIKNIIAFMAGHQLRKKIAFIEDYDINVARYLVQGVDVWLNTPLRPLEACGTSGMKAACNGVLNLSVLDGWWDEAYDFNNGWAIGNREIYPDREYQNDVESKAIYSTIEKDIAPLFYSRGSDGLPREWIKMMKHSLASIASRFNSNRMVKEYFYRFYKEAGRHYASFSADGFAATRQFLLWREKVCREFPAVAIEDVRLQDSSTFKIGDEMKVEVDLQLGRLQPDDVCVDVYYGNPLASDQLSNSRIAGLAEVRRLEGGKCNFSGRIRCDRTGSFGLRIRVTPHHPLLVDPYELNLVRWG